MEGEAQAVEAPPEGDVGIETGAEEGTLEGAEAEAFLDEMSAAPDASEEEPQQELPDRWRVKINGEEREVTREQALKDYELRQASYERMEQASKKEKGVKQLMGRLQGASPEQFAAFMERLGHDPLAFAQAIAERALSRANMTPEQRELEDLRRERQRFDREKQDFERAQREQHIQAQIPVQIQRFTESYNAAMDEAGVPAHEKLRGNLIQRMAARDRAARMNGYEIPASDLLAIEWESLQEASKSYLSNIDDDGLVRVVGDKRMKALRQRDLDALPAVRRLGGAKAPPAEPPAPKVPEYRQYTSGDLDAWRRMLGE